MTVGSRSVQMFGQLIDQTQSALAPGWVGSFIGLIGVGIAIITYVLSRKKKALSYTFEGERLLGLSTGSLPNDITVQYQNSNIPRLTRSTVYLWNSGQLTITRDHLAAADRPRLATGNDGRILAITVQRSSRPAIEFSIVVDPQRPNTAILDFAFLDAADGATIEVLHTSSISSVSFSGTILGMPRGVRNLGRTSPRPLKLPLNMPLPINILGSAIVLIGVVTAVAGFVAPEKAEMLVTFGMTTQATVFFMAVVYISMGGGLIYFFRKKYPKGLAIPENER